jgi:hypothetical protein
MAEQQSGRPTADLSGEPLPVESRAGDDAPLAEASPAAGTSAAGGGQAAPSGAEVPLLEDAEANQLVERWRSVQALFVDEPARAVSEADRLVDDLTQAISTRFRQHTSRMAEANERGDEDSTEQLRLAFQRYRSLFRRLLDA